LNKIRLILNNAIAVAEAVLLDAEKRKLHEPTVEFFRGQKVLAEQILFLLEGGEEPPEEIFHAEIVKGQIVVYNASGELADIVFSDEPE
jgi:hypothetical protein